MVKIKTILISLLLLAIALLFFRRTAEGFAPASSKAMVIIEPREHKDLQRVIKNFDEKMPKDWDLYVFCGKSHVDFAKKAATGVSRKVYVKPLDTDNLTAEEYNLLFETSSFWDRVDAEDILVFQTDAILCGQSKFSISDFINYNYIGCSVNQSTHGYEGPFWYDGKSPFYGIGGLSFRKKSFMKKCILDHKDKIGQMAEDVFFSTCVHETPGKPATGKILTEFCTQYSFQENSFGAHKLKDLKEEDRERFFSYCPESKFLVE